jgi:transposase
LKFNRVKPTKLLVISRSPEKPHQKVASIESLIEQAGAKVIYLSPYSPDFNPIENCWSKLKQYLHSAAARCRDTVEQALVNAIHEDYGFSPIIPIIIM